MACGHVSPDLDNFRDLQCILHSIELTVFFHPATYNVTEGSNVTVSVMVTSANYAFPFSASLSHMDNTAESGKDYSSSVLSVDFSSGQRTVSFDVSTIDDDIVEFTKMFHIVIVNTTIPCRVRPGAPKTVSVNLLDNDGMPGYKTFYPHLLLYA